MFHEIQGSVLKFRYQTPYHFDYKKEFEFGKKFKNDFKDKPNKYSYLYKITGSYLNEIQINDKTYWNINENIPEYIKPVKHSLPSDGRYREDLIWLYRSINNFSSEEESKNYLNIAQEWKYMLENFNRWERKKRADYKKNIIKKK